MLHRSRQENGKRLARGRLTCGLGLRTAPGNISGRGMVATAFPALKLFTNGPFDASHTFDATDRLSRLLVDLNAKSMWCKNGGFGRALLLLEQATLFC